MPETTDRDTVSIEAHNRVVAERDELKAQVADLAGTVKDIGYREKAESWFSGRVDDARGWAELSLPHIRSGEVDDIEATLEKAYGTRLPQMTAPPAPVEEPPAPFEAPRPSVAGPNPAAPSEPASNVTPLVFGSREWTQIISEKGLDGIREAEAQGRITVRRQ